MIQTAESIDLPPRAGGGSSSGLNCTAWTLVMNYYLSVYHKHIIFARNYVDCTRKLYHKKSRGQSGNIFLLTSF